MYCNQYLFDAHSAERQSIISFEITAVTVIATITISPDVSINCEVDNKSGDKMNYNIHAVSASDCYYETQTNKYIK